MDDALYPAFPEYLLMDVAALVPYARNARLHTEIQVREIAASISEFRFITPVVIDGKGEIIAGHGRVLAANLLGMKILPCILADHLSDAQKRQYRLIDNKLGEKSSWDTNLLRIELSELNEMPTIDIQLTGFTHQEFNQLLLSAPPPIPESEDLFDVDEQLQAENRKKRTKDKEASKTTEGYAEFSLVMQVENREQLLDTIKRIQRDRGAETKEDALMAMVASYGE